MILTSTLHMKKPTEKAQPLFDCHIKTKENKSFRFPHFFFKQIFLPFERIRKLSVLVKCRTNPWTNWTFNSLDSSANQRNKRLLRDTLLFSNSFFLPPMRTTFLELVNLADLTFLRMPGLFFTIISTCFPYLSGFFPLLCGVLQIIFPFATCSTTWLVLSRSRKQRLRKNNKRQKFWYSVVDWSMDNYFRKFLLWSFKFIVVSLFLQPGMSSIWPDVSLDDGEHSYIFENVPIPVLHSLHSHSEWFFGLFIFPSFYCVRVSIFDHLPTFFLSFFFKCTPKGDDEVVTASSSFLRFFFIVFPRYIVYMVSIQLACKLSPSHCLLHSSTP